MTAAPPNDGFRAVLSRAPGPALGTWLKIPAMEVVELVALAGFDFVVIDMEHAPIDTESAYRMIGTARHTGMVPVVRVPSLDPGLVQRLLDAGAEGIMVPHVDTEEQARAAVAAMRFPPLGTRGVGATGRAGAWGILPLEEYLRHGQQEVVLIAQIESAVGVRNAGAIAAVEGLDALLVGLADLSVSEGRAPTDPHVTDMVAHVVEQGRSAGVPVGNAGGASSASVRAAVETGFAFTMLSNDASLLGAAATAAVVGARSVAGG